MQTWPEQWEAKGRQEGRLEGEAAVLQRQIRLKFGSPDETVQARIKAADAEQLLQWAERVLTAETLEDVFGNGDGSA